MRFLLLFIHFVIWMRANTKAVQLLQKKPLITLHQWTNLELSLHTAEYEYKVKTEYENIKLLPVDLEVEYGDDGSHRTFLTIPRLSPGVPYSLAVVANSDDKVVVNPKLQPYPNRFWHPSPSRANCSKRAIISAIRTYIDECWRLWVIDSGQINSQQYCDPQVLAFDLVNDKLVHRYSLPQDVYTPGVSVFTALTVDVVGKAEPKSDCRDAIVYIADPWGYGLIVYDVMARKTWRIEHALMRPDKQLQSVNAASDGIFTVSLSPKPVDNSSLKKNGVGDRQLYFHALNSYKEIAIPLKFANNATFWLKEESHDEAINVLGTRGTQCESEAMDSAGNLYCSLINSNALFTWHEGNQYNSDQLKVVAYNPEQLKFITGLKINRNSADEDEIWALSSEPMLFVGGLLKDESIKFQIVGCRTKNILGNEPCTVEAVEK